MGKLQSGFGCLLLLSTITGGTKLVHREPLILLLDVVAMMNCQIYFYCCSFTYRRKKRVADAESRIRGEVLVGDEADPDLTAFRSLAGWYQL